MKRSAQRHFSDLKTLSRLQKSSISFTHVERIQEFVSKYSRWLKDIPGISVVKPEAAFYCFPKLDVKKFNIHDDEKFALDVLRQKKILFTHGGGFHWEQPDHFRIVYLPDVSVLKEASDKMAEFLADYRQK